MPAVNDDGVLIFQEVVHGRGLILIKNRRKDMRVKIEVGGQMCSQS